MRKVLLLATAVFVLACGSDALSAEKRSFAIDEFLKQLGDEKRVQVQEAVPIFPPALSTNIYSSEEHYWAGFVDTIDAYCAGEYAMDPEIEAKVMDIMMSPAPESDPDNESSGDRGRNEAAEIFAKGGKSDQNIGFTCIFLTVKIKGIWTRRPEY